MMQQPTVKLAVIGATGCGKTSLVRRHVEGSFDSSGALPRTVGLDFSAKLQRCESRGVDCRQMIWDMPADPIYASIVHTYASQADAVVLIFDITRPSTLSFLEASARSLRAEQCAILVGCKADIGESDLLESQQYVSWDRGQALPPSVAGDSCCRHWRVSAKTGDGVEAVFQEVVELVLKKREAAVAAAANGRLLTGLSLRPGSLRTSFRLIKKKVHTFRRKAASE